MAASRPETDPHAIDPIARLSALNKKLDPVQVREEFTLLKPALADLYQTDRAIFTVAAELVKERLGIDRRDLESSLCVIRTVHNTPSQATRLVELAEDIELFHTPDGEAWATLVTEGHREHWPLKTKGMRRWLARQFYEEEGKAPGSQALQDALGVLEGKARYDGEEHPVFTRVADHQGAIYLDLANDQWEAIEITNSGWQIIAAPPIRFRRTKGMLPLPYPAAGGSVNDLRPFVNIRNEEEWTLLIAWLLMTYVPRGPYPVLGLSGQQGSTKSTTAKVLRSLVDPSSAPLRTAPREERDLMISANAGWLLAFDNLSFLPHWLSDAFSRLATGGGFSTRELYTNDEEVLFDAQRPLLFTAIEDIGLSGDLVDWGVRLLLPPVPNKKRKTESVFWKEFEAVRPRILGALLDIVASAQRHLPTVKLDELPRMVDFALWATAAEPALQWKPGTFLRAYTKNRTAADEIILDASSVAAAVRMLAQKGPWAGTATELLDTLSELLPEKETKAKSWPKNPLSLSNALRRLAPSLGAIGIQIDFEKTSGGGSKRLIMIRTSTESSDADDAGDAPDDTPRDFAEDSVQDDATLRNGRATQDSNRASPKNPSKNGHCDAGDASDAQKSSYSKSAQPGMWEENL